MKTHRLKTLSKYFKPVKDGFKMFELRKNDRDYQVGDILILDEVGEDGTTVLDTVKRKITYILEGGKYGLDPNYVILSLGFYTGVTED